MDEILSLFLSLSLSISISESFNLPQVVFVKKSNWNINMSIPLYLNITSFCTSGFCQEVKVKDKSLSPIFLRVPQQQRKPKAKPIWLQAAAKD